MTKSILTNTSAMVALQTLKSTNSNLQEVNNQISTGKEVASAKDNASLFAISEVMEADVAGFKAVSDSLSLGQSTLAVASNAAESVGDLLNDIKGKIVAANEDNVDRQKLQNEIDSLVGQVEGIVDSAQFNGLNLLNGAQDANGGFSVLSSLDRDSSGTVTTSNIQFDTTETNLSTSQNGRDLINNGGAIVTQNTINAAATDPADVDVGRVAGDIPTTGTGFNLSGATPAANTLDISDFQILDAAGAAGANSALKAEDVDLVGGAPDDGLIAGDRITFEVGSVNATYTVQEGDETEDIATGIKSALAAGGLDIGDANAEFSVDTNGTNLVITNNTEQSVNGFYQISRDSGGLAGLDNIDVVANAGAALNQIEGFIQTAVDAQAELGTTESRLAIQNDFMSSLIDSFEAGIGSLVDADMEEASARLQSLQVQQQLGTQALSIANQQPQNLLALFR